MKSNVDDPSNSDKVLKCRLGVLGAECCRLMDVACKNSSDFVKAMNDVVNSITKLQKRGENPRKGNLDDNYVVDPLVVKSKGAPKKNSKFKQRRRCSNCGVIGHYNKSCPNVPGRISKEPVDDDTEKNIKSRSEQTRVLLPLLFERYSSSLHRPNPRLQNQRRHRTAVPQEAPNRTIIASHQEALNRNSPLSRHHRRCILPKIVAASSFPASLSLSSPRHRCFFPLYGFSSSPFSTVSLRLLLCCFSPVLPRCFCFTGLCFAASALLLLLYCIGRLWVVIYGLHIKSMGNDTSAVPPSAICMQCS
ncbi:uncharacterized protein LOC110265039 [Arachis ipaensis]|uniref:uncharacterized protein LOC110265039 n=1 Tax=Arachis ipaensis TaxID=130454 RepID=UPI000A2B5A8D|nr:uncharacterized protein LOC110265039 [Arachis ipaensis]